MSERLKGAGQRCSPELESPDPGDDLRRQQQPQALATDLGGQQGEVAAACGPQLVLLTQDLGTVLPDHRETYSRLQTRREEPSLDRDKAAAVACAHSPIVASHHPVGVQHGNELKDEHPPQHLGAGVLLPQDEVQEAVEDEAGGCFSWVDSAAQEKHLGAERQG